MGMRMLPGWGVQCQNYVLALRQLLLRHTPWATANGPKHQLLGDVMAHSHVPENRIG